MAAKKKHPKRKRRTKQTLKPKALARKYRLGTRST